MKVTVRDIKKLGFDESKRNGRFIRVKCSQCEALVINRVPTHEHGCPNIPKKRR